MSIRILEVDEHKNIEVGQLGEKEVLAYWCKFESPLCIGFTYILPYSNDLCRFKNDYMYVETTQKAVRDFLILHNYIEKKPKIEPQIDETDFLIVGKVDCVHLDENGNVEVIYVLVDDITFAFDDLEIGNCEPKKEDWIKCSIRGLIFYDEGY